MPNIPEVILRSFLSLVTLFLLTKALGNRQMSQLSMFDYIAGISIGSLAAEAASHQDGFLHGIVAMAVFAGVTLLINLLNDKSLKLRRFFLGEPLVLYDNGTIYYKNLRKAKLDLTEFMTQCRGSGFFDLTKLHMVILEVNGKLSFLPAETERPLTPSDMNLAPKQQRPVIPVVTDGTLLPQGLEATGNNEAWLRKQIQSQGFSGLEDILLGTVDTDNNLVLYEKKENKQSRNYYG